MGDHNQDDTPSATETSKAAESHKIADDSAHEPTDAELATAVCNGDQDAFATLFERHRLRVAIVAGRFFRHREEIEDVLQEVFAKAYFAIREFSDDGTGSMAGWLSKIAFNTCYDELRRRRRKPESGAAELTDEETQTVRSLVTTEISVESASISRDLAYKLLSRVSPEDRIVLVLLDVEGLTTGEIGQVLGWSSAKVKIRAFRARKDLRRILRKLL